MKHITMSQFALLNARAEDAYALIADYRHGHPRIVPPEHFSNLEVEQGGYGEGTIIRFNTTVLGTTQAAYQRVTEPEPGHVLVEQDIDSARNVITTFTVTPVEQGRTCRVEIATVMNVSAGLRGIIEGFLIRRIFPRIYRKELAQLERVAQQDSSAAHTASMS